ncbi:MAG: periplasmic heavy metal sensor [Bacteroidetes bacterium]|nr:periplasmic heavy metal sensor [Bacteroidota bacterium]
MNKVKLLSWLVGILVLLNVAILFFVVGRPPMFPNGPHLPEHGGPKRLIIEKLHFDQIQKQAYEKLIRAHRSKIDSLDREIRFCKNELYGLLQDNPTDAVAKNKLIAKLGQLQTQIEQTHFEHFADIKKLCHPDQISDYNALTTELAALFSHPPKPKHD